MPLSYTPYRLTYFYYVFPPQWHSSVSASEATQPAERKRVIWLVTETVCWFLSSNNRHSPVIADCFMSLEMGFAFRNPFYI